MQRLLAVAMHIVVYLTWRNHSADSIDLKGFGPLRNVFRHLYLERWPLAAGSTAESGPEPALEEISGMLVRDLSIHPLVHVRASADATGAVTLQASLAHRCSLRYLYGGALERTAQNIIVFGSLST